ncbi:D-sedoheptulose-7-phosphate isomerase [Paenibacillus ginsengarvi]|uniref:SIS domain-containing protein n=1 Tax=Paenibacillus ginsengarvi TaxID=400777 RepID=A0A3B0C0P4_9BACL|nr:SIS domain-containing protein [Paenibacillus ginsengarvi]RKN79233.1 SIS domain-containing protein [Paenibacillus ginsengarvi]
MHDALKACITKYPELAVNAADIERAFEIVRDSYSGGGKVLLAGNGGSASDCEHIVGELMKGFMSRRPISPAVRQSLRQFGEAEGDYLADRLQGALPAISLVSHTSLMTAYANDVAADMVFAQQVFGYGKPGDVLIGLSTSGNSANVVRALQVARAMDMCTIGLTGRSGGAMKELCDVTIRVPYDVTPDIQERHLPIYHALCIMLEDAFFRVS